MGRNLSKDVSDLFKNMVLAEQTALSLGSEEIIEIFGYGTVRDIVKPNIPASFVGAAWDYNTEKVVSFSAEKMFNYGGAAGAITPGNEIPNETVFAMKTEAERTARNKAVSDYGDLIDEKAQEAKEFAKRITDAQDYYESPPEDADYQTMHANLDFLINECGTTFRTRPDTTYRQLQFVVNRIESHIGLFTENHLSEIQDELEQLRGLKKFIKDKKYLGREKQFENTLDPEAVATVRMYEIEQSKQSE